MMKRALLIVLLALGGCQPETPEDTGPPDLSGYDPEAATRAQQICETDGGNWAKGGLAGGFVCFMPTRDANERCTSGTQCDGLCLARSQTCAPITPFFGCHEVLTDSGVRATLCID